MSPKLREGAFHELNNEKGDLHETNVQGGSSFRPSEETLFCKFRENLNKFPDYKTDNKLLISFSQ